MSFYALQVVPDLEEVVDVYCLLHAIMNATKVFTRRIPPAGAAAAAAEEEDESDEDELVLEDGDDEPRTYIAMRSVFHWLAKSIRSSRLRREIFSTVQTKPVESGGAGLPPLMVGAALEHKFVADDVELGTMLKNVEVFRLLMENELDNASFGYHGTQGAAAKKTKFRNAVHQFIADAPALRLIYPVLQKAARCD
jgi:hypothetical protein